MGQAKLFGWMAVGLRGVTSIGSQRAEKICLPDDYIGAMKDQDIREYLGLSKLLPHSPRNG